MLSSLLERTPPVLAAETLTLLALALVARLAFAALPSACSTAPVSLSTCTLGYLVGKYFSKSF